MDAKDRFLQLIQSFTPVEAQNSLMKITVRELALSMKRMRSYPFGDRPQKVSLVTN